MSRHIRTRKPIDRPRWNEKNHLEMVGELSKANEELRASEIKLMEEHASDAWKGDEAPAKLIRYKVEQEHHAMLLRTRDSLATRVERHLDYRPRLKQHQSWSDDCFRRFMGGGGDNLDKDERDFFIGKVTPEMLKLNPLLGLGGDVFFSGGVDGSQIDLAVGDPTRSDINTGDSAAGLAAPETWQDGLVERLKYFGAVAGMCWNFSTDDGNTRHVNQMDSTAEEGGSMVDQSQAATGKPGDPRQLPNVTDIEFNAYWRHSKFMDARLESFNDLHFDISNRIQREAMRRMGRGWNRWFTTGDGTSKPHGIVAAATVIDGGAGSADDGSGGIKYKNLLDCEYGVEMAYLEGNEGGDGGFMDEQMGQIGFMINRNIERGLRNAVDADSRPLWTPNLETGRAIQGAAGRILGYPYSINQHMANGKTANDLPVLFGNFGHYGVRNVTGIMFYRFWDSSTAERMAVRFIGMSRRDGRSIGPTVANKNEALVALQVKG